MSDADGRRRRQHHVEVYVEGTRFCWRCFEPSCGMGETGFEDLGAADASADEHFFATRAGHPEATS